MVNNFLAIMNQLVLDFRYHTYLLHLTGALSTWQLRYRHLRTHVANGRSRSDHLKWGKIDSNSQLSNVFFSSIGGKMEADQTINQSSSIFFIDVLRQRSWINCLQ